MHTRLRESRAKNRTLRRWNWMAWTGVEGVARPRYQMTGQMAKVERLWGACGCVAIVRHEPEMCWKERRCEVLTEHRRTELREGGRNLVRREQLEGR